MAFERKWPVGTTPAQAAKLRAAAKADELAAQRAAAIEADASSTEPIETAPIPNPVYLWCIPSPLPGYEFRIEVAGASSVEDARLTALAHELPTGGVNEMGGTATRPLNAHERNWVETVAPLVVRDADTVTLDLDGALREVARVQHELDGYAATAETFRRLGIDIHDPQAWVDDVKADASAVVADAVYERDSRHKRLVAALQALQATMTAVIEQTGFAPEPPAEVVEPDYTRLTVVAPCGATVADYPRLSGAIWTDRPLDAPLTAEEAEGLRLLVKDDGTIDRASRGSDYDEAQVSALKAIEAKLVALVGR